LHGEKLHIGPSVPYHLGCYSVSRLAKLPLAMMPWL
jgi:hypothetical protein